MINNAGNGMTWFMHSFFTAFRFDERNFMNDVLSFNVLSNVEIRNLRTNKVICNTKYNND